MYERNNTFINLQSGENLMDLNITGNINKFVHLFTGNWKIVVLIGGALILFVIYTTFIKHG